MQCPACQSTDTCSPGGGRQRCRSCGHTWAHGPTWLGASIDRIVSTELPCLSPCTALNGDQPRPKPDLPKPGIKIPKAGRTHLVIPDTQVRKGVPTDHLHWIGQYIADRKPDVIVHLADHWDMPSLATFDAPGSMSLEGARYADDIESGNEAFAALCKPWQGGDYKPECHLTLGNHEQRIERAINRDPRFAGTIGYHHFNATSLGFAVHGFLEPVFIDGVCYSHFFANPMTGKPRGGLVSTRLKEIGHSFTMGHVQTLDTAIRYVMGPNGPQQQRGLVAGACYLHDEAYKGPQGNPHWRGLIVKHEVHNGGYHLMEVSLDFLCRKYEGLPLADFLAKKYPQQTFACAA